MNKLIIKNIKISATTIDFINADFKKDFLLIPDENDIIIEFFTNMEDRFGRKINENIARNWLLNCQREINGFAQPVYSEFKVKRRMNIFKSLLKSDENRN